MSYNTYGQKSRGARTPIPVWAEVRGVKHGGGSIDLSDFPVGGVIPAGTPVNLDKSGGTLTPLYLYEAVEDVLVTGKDITVRANVAPAVGDFLMVFAEEGKGVKVNKVVEDHYGVYTITVAEALGVIEEGDILIGADKADAATSKPKVDLLPTGLLWHDIGKEEGDTWGTGAVVDEGRIYEDRIVGVPSVYKTAMPSVKFEKGI